MPYAASVVWLLSSPLMSSFRKAEAAIFRMQAMPHEDFPFS